MTEENPEKWSKIISCRSCGTNHLITSNDIVYGDLRQPGMNMPDNQYYIECNNCGRVNILNSIPSRIAIWVQTRINL